jgi:Ca2+-binding RTX toxin-like protein
MRLSTLLAALCSRSAPIPNNARTARRRVPQLHLDTLEARDLKSGDIAGVSLSNGMLSISGTQFSGNTAAVSIDPTNQMVKVDLNGASEEFAPSQISAVFYNGGQGGGDTFVNSTNLLAIEYGWGGNNTFTGGGGQDYMFLFGDNNTVTAGSGFEVAYTHGGNDNISGGALRF